MNTPHYTKIHNRFQLKGYYFSADELKDIGYDFIKEGVPYEIAIGKFIMDWMDKEEFINVKTSGSTGDPKIIKLSKQAMVNSAIRTGDFFDVQIGDSALHCLPLIYCWKNDVGSCDDFRIVLGLSSTHYSTHEGCLQFI